MSIAFEKASQSFLVSLRSGGKSHNTIRNYASDLETLGSFLREHKLDYKSLALVDLDNYHRSLKIKGLKPNSRRRKIVTAKTFLRFMSAHIDLSTVGSEKVIPPEKVEKPPKLVAPSFVEAVIADQPLTPIGCRNRALIRVLWETGALVTEVLALKKTDFTKTHNGAVIIFRGKRTRQCNIGPKATAALDELKAQLQSHQNYLFYGYTRGGPNPEKLSPRGVEMLFKAWSKKFKVKHFKPRIMRHLFVMRQLLHGRSETEVMGFLGLRTGYVFRIYRPLLAQQSVELQELAQA